MDQYNRRYGSIQSQVWINTIQVWINTVTGMDEYKHRYGLIQSQVWLSTVTGMDQYNRRYGSIQSQVWLSTVTGMAQYRHRYGSIQTQVWFVVQKPSQCGTTGNKTSVQYPANSNFTDKNTKWYTGTGLHYTGYPTIGTFLNVFQISTWLFVATGSA